MGSLILCHKKKARTPYEIVRIQRRIYTIEELCYYLCNHLYLVDHTIMNEALCEWIADELDLKTLAQELHVQLAEHGSMEQFVLTILASASIYSAAELNHIQNVLEKLKSQRPVEKQKFKADNLLTGGSPKAAIAIYQAILREEKDESLSGNFYGKVYSNLGAAYGQLFLYKEAAKMYEAAFQICEEEAMLKAFLYACKMYMSETEYHMLLKRSAIYQGIDEVIYADVSELETEIQELAFEDSIENWKKQYRKISAGEM